MCWLPLLPSSLLQGQYICVCVCQQCLISHYPQNGVLQGSILSVTLFTAAINKMVNTVGWTVTTPACVKNITSYYASCSPVKIEWQLQPTTNPLSHWTLLPNSNDLVCYGVCDLPCISTLVTVLQCLFHLTELNIKANGAWCYLVLQKFNNFGNTYCFHM